MSQAAVRLLYFTVRRFGCAIVCLFLGGAWVDLNGSEQAPVPNVSPQSSSISGTVTDASGAVVPGAQITITNSQTGQSWSSLTGSDGRYEMRGLPVGDYKVRAELAGFKGEERSATIGLGRSATLDFRFGGPVPDVTPGASTKTAKPKETEKGSKVPAIYRWTAADGPSLQQLIDTKASDGFTLVSIVSTSDKTGLFLFEKDKKRFSYLITPANEALNEGALTTSLQQYTGKTFVGALRMAENSFLLVFRYARK